METLSIALFLSIVTNRLIAAFTAPIKQKYPTLDMWWLIYVAWVVAGGLAWASGINLFDAYLPDPLIGRILTATVCGGGANLLNDIFKPGDEPLTNVVILEQTTAPDEQ